MMYSVALLGVRVTSYCRGGRRVTICSVAPERHRMPIATSSLATCDVKVTSATSVRSNRLRSLADVVEAATTPGDRLPLPPTRPAVAASARLPE